MKDIAQEYGWVVVCLIILLLLVSLPCKNFKEFIQIWFLKGDDEC